MKIFVTGGTGFLGSHLIEAILSHKDDFGIANSDLRVLVRNLSKASFLKSRSLNLIEGELDIISLKRGLNGVDLIFHLAGKASDTATWNELYQTNVEGTKRLLKLMSQICPSAFLVHFSSTGIYGLNLPPKPILESYNRKPRNQSLYQKSKLFQEREVRNYCEKSGLAYTVIRPPQALGPRDLVTTYKVLEAVKAGKFPLVGGGKNELTFADARDIAEAAVFLALNSDKTTNNIYNMYSFVAKLKDYLGTLKEFAGIDAEQKVVNYKLAYTIATLSEYYGKITRKKTTINRYRVGKFGQIRLYDDNKIRSLGFTPMYNLRTSIEDTIQWLVSNTSITLPRFQRDELPTTSFAPTA